MEVLFILRDHSNLSRIQYFIAIIFLKLFFSHEFRFKTAQEPRHSQKWTLGQNFSMSSMKMYVYTTASDNFKNNDLTVHYQKYQGSY